MKKYVVVLLRVLLGLCFSILSKIRNDVQKSIQQHDEITSQTFTKHEQRVNSLRVDLNLLEEQMTQRINNVNTMRFALALAA